MCGILGTINSSLSLDKVRSYMYHRGPDSQTIWSDELVAMVHFRLSVVDKTGGEQPMHLDDRYVVIFNGELYNHLELRETYQLECTSNSDTETLLRLYHKLGTKCLEKMDAMYAFAIYDRQEGIVFFARDKAGKKPLYIYQKDGILLFGSELNSLRKLIPNVEVNELHIQKYLLNGSMVRRDTVYNDIIDFPAASYAIYDINTDRLDIVTWWEILNQYLKPSIDDYSTAKEKVRGYLGRHVENRLISSDLEVGCFLSGGIDSGLITGLAAKHVDKLKTFTVAFDGPFNESSLAKQVSDKYYTDHTEIRIRFDDLSQNIESIISGFGEPFFDSSAIPSWYVSKEAKKHVTVILNGDGADELFGGYRRYIPFKQLDLFKSGLSKNILAALGNMLPKANTKKSIYNYIFRLSRLAGKSNIPLYLSSGVDIFSDYENLLNFDVYSPWEKEEPYFEKVLSSNLTGMQKLLTIDFDINLFSDLLVKMDTATMAHSLEGRSPFLGTDLLDYVPTIKDDYKVSGKTSKYILRDLAKEYLPTDLIHQPKRGFEIPLKDWTKGIIKEPIGDYILSKDSFSTRFITLANKEKLFNYSANVPEEKNAKMLYTLFALDVWFKNK